MTNANDLIHSFAGAEWQNKRKQTKKIAFIDIDNEGDRWRENVFMFESEEDVEGFFKADNPTLIYLYTDEDKEIKDMTITRSGTTRQINRVEFYTDYAHNVTMERAKGGYFIQEPKINFVQINNPTTLVV